jgi:alpha-D-xyloside xylohydrolase
MTKASPLSPLKPLSWKRIAPGVWRARVGRKDHLDLLTAADATISHAGFRQLPSIATPPIDFALSSGETVVGHTVVRVPLLPDEKLYGLGLQMHGSDRRGSVYHLRMDHYSSGKDRLHAPTPLYISSKGYAIFFNTSRPISLYAGVGNRFGSPGNPPARDRNTDPDWEAQPSSDAVEASVQASGLEVYLFAGPTPLDALRRYTLFCGGGALPPRWALGFWHRVPLAATAEEVINETEEFDRRGFPLDVVGLEPGWQSRSYPGTFVWSDTRFPDSAGFLQQMTANHLHINLWENPYVAESSPLFPPLKPYFASHTVWLGAVPDLHIPEAATIVRQHHRTVGVDCGVSGYKMDEVDGFDNWLWPDHAAFPSGIPGDQMRQVYGVLWQRELYRLFRDSGRRTFGLVRGSNGGATRFPFALYSDTYDHREYVTGIVNAGLAGVLWCAEARSAANGEEWVRRMQTAVLSHIAQLNAWSDGTKPWSFPGFEEPVRKAMEFRSSISPYLYTAFAQYHYEGTPVIRAMSLIDGGNETDQYLLGDAVLVAPMFAGEKTRNVRLPKGDWFDYDTGAFAGHDTIIEITPPLDKIPLFVRDGALIPTIPPQRRTGHLAPGTRLTLRRYGTHPEPTGRLYEDDGETFGYEQGDYSWTDLTLNPEGHAVMTLREGKRPLSFGPIDVQTIGQFGIPCSPPTSRTSNEGAISKFDSGNHRWSCFGETEIETEDSTDDHEGNQN